MFGFKQRKEEKTMQAIIGEVTYVGTPESIWEVVRLSKSEPKQPVMDDTDSSPASTPIEEAPIEAMPETAPKNRIAKQFGYRAPKKNVPYTRIRHERMLKNWTSYYASLQTDISGAQYGKIENAYVIALRNRQIDISKLYGLPPRELFDYYGRAKLYKPQDTSK